jgi:hypothetical protein
MALLEEAKEVRAALAEVIRQEVERLTQDCFRVRKAVVKTAPNSSTGKCSVQLVGDDTILSIPYSSEVASVSAGSVVWVAWWGGSMRNAIVWQTADFK